MIAKMLNISWNRGGIHYNKRRQVAPSSLLKALLLGLVSVVVEASQLTLPPPQQLRQKAEKSRNDFVNTLLDIEAQLHNIRDPKTFQSYFILMDEWEVLAGRWRMQDFYPDAVKNLGQKMASHGLKWVNLWEIGDQDLERHLRYYDEQNFWSLQSLTFYNVKRIQPLALPQYERTFQASDLVMKKYLLVQYQHRTDLVQSYLDLQGYIATLALKLKLNSDQLSLWRSRLNSPNALAELLTDWESALQRADRLGGDSLEKLTQAVQLVFDQSTKIERFYSLQWLLEKAVSLWSEAWELALRFSWRIPQGDTQDLMERMSWGQKKIVAQKFMYLDERLWAEKGSSQHIEIARYLAQLMKKETMLDAELRRYEQWLARLEALVSVRTSSLSEGTYLLTSSKGNKYRLSIARYETGRLAIGLMDERQFFGLKFFHVSYDHSAQEWVAMYSENSNDLKEYPHIIRIRKVDDTKIRVLNSYAFLDDRDITGTRIEDYPSVQFYPSRFLKEGVHEFHGTLQYNTQGANQSSALKASLVLQVIGDQVFGRMDFDGHMFWYDFKSGLVSANKDIVLTAEIKNNTWVQLRGKILEDGSIEAVLIVGGRGITTGKFRLQPMKQQ